jgi:hypothetical protein
MAITWPTTYRLCNLLVQEKGTFYGCRKIEGIAWRLAGGGFIDIVGCRVSL